jgi:hypothetical protein
MRAKLKVAQPREWQPCCRARSLSTEIRQDLKIENLFKIAHDGDLPGSGSSS